MTIELHNIGMIKEATVKIDGLTVIAGENDTGKSTVGKALLFANEVNYHPKIVEINIHEIELYDEYSDNDNAKIWLDVNVKNLFQKIFSFTPSFDSKISSTYKVNHVVFIETPIVANLFSFFSKLDTIQTDLEYKISNYPYLFRHLFKQLKLELKNENLFKNDLINIIDSIIGGRLKVNKLGELIFDKQEQQYEVNAIATGIKNFGVLQVLLNNNYLTRDALLIVDEPEVHLHPKWQLNYAQIIIELVKKGVKVLINSHSPYMIEALKRYSEVAKIENKTNFYLAEEGYITKQESLENIFEKLALPMRELKKLKMDRYLND